MVTSICSACKGPVQEDQVWVEKLPCGHLRHKICPGQSTLGDRFNKKWCPMCGQNVQITFHQQLYVIQLFIECQKNEFLNPFCAQDEKQAKEKVRNVLNKIPPIRPLAFSGKELTIPVEMIDKPFEIGNRQLTPTRFEKNEDTENLVKRLKVIQERASERPSEKASEKASEKGYFLTTEIYELAETYSQILSFQIS